MEDPGRQWVATVREAMDQAAEADRKAADAMLAKAYSAIEAGLVLLRAKTVLSEHEWQSMPEVLEITGLRRTFDVEHFMGLAQEYLAFVGDSGEFENIEGEWVEVPMEEEAKRYAVYLNYWARQERESDEERGSWEC